MIFLLKYPTFFITSCVVAGQGTAGAKQRACKKGDDLCSSLADIPKKKDFNAIKTHISCYTYPKNACCTQSCTRWNKFWEPKYRWKKRRKNKPNSHSGNNRTVTTWIHHHWLGHNQSTPWALGTFSDAPFSRIYLGISFWW